MPKQSPGNKHGRERRRQPEPLSRRAFRAIACQRAARQTNAVDGQVTSAVATRISKVHVNPSKRKEEAKQGNWGEQNTTQSLSVISPRDDGGKKYQEEIPAYFPARSFSWYRRILLGEHALASWWRERHGLGSG